jgi:arginase
MVEAVRREVGRALREGRMPLVVGGECPLLLGCLAAAHDAYGRVGLLFVDGHEDAWPPEQSMTGEAADMELGLALGLTSITGMPRLANLLPLIRPEDTILLGPRDRAELDAERAQSIAANVTFKDDVALLNGDAGAIATIFSEHLHRDIGRWWFHVDLDVLTTEAMPAVRYPQPGGLEWKHLQAITEATLGTPGLIGWDITIYNPDLDPDHRSAERIVACVESALTQKHAV